MAVAVVTLLITGLRPGDWTLAPTIALLMSGGVWLQHWAGLIVHPSDALMASLQLFACAVIWIVVRAIDQKEALSRLGDVIFGALVIAGIGSVAGTMVQALQISDAGAMQGIGLWVMAIPEGVRPAGNVAQPNEMATLLMWAMVGGVWAVHRKSVRLSIFCLMGCYLAIGLAISHSRVGLMESMALLGLLMVLRNHFGGWKLSLVYAAILCVQLLLFWNMQAISDGLLLEYRGRVIEQLTDNVARLSIYKMVWGAIVQSPWWGYGMTSLTSAQWVVSDQFPPLNAYYRQSHNIVLDLLAWWGIPVGGLLFFFAARWCVQVIRDIKDASQCIFGFALVMFILHAFVELPHWSVAYLFPATIFAAALDSSLRRLVLWRTQLGSVAAYVGMLCSALALLTVEYLRLERNYVHLRAEEVGLRTITEVPPTFLLTNLADYLRLSRIIGHTDVPPQTIAWMEYSIHGIPNYNTQLTHAVTLALNGRQEEALVWMRRLNSVSPPSYHAGYLRVWRYFQRTYPQLIGQMQWPDLVVPVKP